MQIRGKCNCPEKKPPTFCTVERNSNVVGNLDSRARKSGLLMRQKSLHITEAFELFRWDPDYLQYTISVYVFLRGSTVL